MVSFTLFPTSGRRPKEAYKPECLVPTVQHGGRSVMIWAAIPWYSAGPVITLNGRNTASDCVDIVANQTHPTVQMLFPNNDPVLQDNNLPIRTHSQQCSVLVWGAWRCISKSSLASITARLKYHQTTVVSFREQVEKQIASSITSQATRIWSSWAAVQYSSRDCSELIWVYSKNDTICITGKWWPNSLLIGICVSFTTVFSILTVPCTWPVLFFIGPLYI